MTDLLSKDYSEFKNYFETESLKYFDIQLKKYENLELLWKSMQYTFFLDSKRFRPYLVYLIGKIFKIKFETLFSYALAIEIIHTYSLIHDDLPALDNDDFRRGQLSNHKVFGEDIALLSGDALQAEAFYLISEIKNIEPVQLLKIIKILAFKIGPRGMVGGQILDMKVNSDIKLLELQNIHLLKTAYLIESAVIGAAILAKANDNQLVNLSNFAINLGIAFQIKDDLLDGLDSDQDYKNYIKVIGLEKTQQELVIKSQLAVTSLVNIQSNLFHISDLESLVQYNIERTK